MSKSLNLLAAAALLAALGACNRQPAAGVTPDDDRQLNEARNMLADPVIDTSPDDASVNAEDMVEENAPEAAPANSAGERTANQQ